jgi:hexosaminidase
LIELQSFSSTVNPKISHYLNIPMFMPLVAAIAILPQNQIAIIPKPKMMEVQTGTFTINSQTTITNHSSKEATRTLKRYLSPATGYTFDTNPKPDNSITLEINDHLRLDPEGYQLQSTPESLTITAATETGLFYGIQSLRQLLPTSIFASTPQSEVWQIPCVSIDDSPRFKWRGIMLDVARHFSTKNEVLKFIDALAIQKINTFHFHLTDDQGWRIEIKKYPRLTEVGSMRKHTVVGHNTDKYDGIPHGGFYTQADLKEIVAYAQARKITIVPEIDMPGHMIAAIAAYPDLGDGKPAEVFPRWGVESRVLNLSDQTVQFCRDVLTEVMDIFPSQFIHIGGDECPKTQWKNDPAEQARMKARGLKDEHELQSWFIQQMEDHLHKNGRRLIGWDEILEGGLPKRSAVMSWRGISGGLTAANLGQDVVMTPTSHLYLDYYQGKPAEEPDAIGGFVPLSKTYSFDPTVPGITPGNENHILGVQGNIWTEYMKTYSQREYMAYPRACAVAEIGWTPQSSRDYSDFMTRLTPHLERLKNAGINFRTPKATDLSVDTWSPKDLKEDWTTLNWDISASIKSSGDYRITFMYTGGSHRLDIQRAEIWINNKKVAEDIHDGQTGGSHKANQYLFKNLQIPSGAKVQLFANVRPDGGTDSSGNIYIEKL